MSRFLLHTGPPVLGRPVCPGCLRQEMFATIRLKDVLPQWGTELPLCLWCIGSLHWKAGLSLRSVTGTGRERCSGGLIHQAGAPLAGRTLLEEGERHK